MTQADEKRRFQYELASGAHLRPEEGRCAMEWVSFLAGEPHSDSPICVAPVLRAFCVRFNDSLGYGDRQKLRPYLARTIGTVEDGLDAARVWMCVDWLVRTYTPAWLDVVGRTESAAALRQHRPITSKDVLRDVAPLLGGEITELRWQQIVSSRAPRYPGETLVVMWEPTSPVAWASEVFYADGQGDRRTLVPTVRELARDVAMVMELQSPLRGLLVTRILRTNAKLRESLFDLLDRMLPTEVIQLPAVPEWREVCGVAG